MRIYIARRTLLFWIALGSGPFFPSHGLFAASSAVVAPPDAPVTSATLDVGQALQEMAELESRIEQAQRLQFEEQRRLLEASRSLQSVRSSLERKDRLNREGEQFLQSYGERVRAGMQSVDEQVEADGRTIGVSRASLGLTRAALLAGSAAPAAATPELLALGLLQEAHRDRARIASRRILDLESRRTELAGKSEHAVRSVQVQSVFSQYSLQQLRQRHEALAGQVTEAQSQSDAQTRQVAQLAGRRGELKELIARLAEQEAAQAAPPPHGDSPPGTVPAVAPAVTASPTPTPVPVRPLLNGVEPPVGAQPVRSGDSPQGTVPAPGAAEVPYEEGSGPLIGAIRTSEDKDQTDAAGTRFLFWRARPMGVCALAAGKVLFSGNFAGYRHLLIIDHGGGWRSLYGNMAQCALVPGVAVQAGQALGQYQAVQGARAEPLWFELRQGVQAVAPESWPAMPAQWQGRLLARLQDQAAR